MGAVLYALCGVAHGQLITATEAQKYRKNPAMFETILAVKSNTLNKEYRQRGFLPFS